MMKTTISDSPTSIREQVRKLKEDHASKYDFDPDAIAAAAKQWEASNPERMAKPEDLKKASESYDLR